MKWEKKGFIWSPSGEYDFMNSHTSPINAVLVDDVIRVYFSSRGKIDKDGNYTSYPCYVDLNRNNPQEIVNICKKPIIELGDSGYFDEHGIMVAKSIKYKEELWMYYMGWQRHANKKAPYQVSLGLAKSYDNGRSFKKYSKGPIMCKDIYDPISIGNVYTIIKDDIWYMYYTSYSRWEYNGIKATPEYNIKLATSRDGIIWEKRNIVIISEDKNGGVATPCVFKYRGKYRMLFGYRKSYSPNGQTAGYKIGYAESDDLVHWTRNDEPEIINPSTEGWDSEMICYPDVLEIDGKIYMFYCGNGFGATGFGYAELVE